MRRRDFYWSLFQKSEKRQIDDLRTEYVEVAFEVLPKSIHDDWLVWREGFRSWKPLSDFPSLLSSLREGNVGVVPQPAPPVAAAKGSAGSGGQVASGGGTIKGGAAAAGSAQGSSASSSNPNSDTKQSGASKSDPAATLIAEKKTSVLTRLERAAGGGNLEADFALSDESASDDRDVRYPKKWDVRIANGGKTIANQTIDVSVKGMALRDPLPRGLANYFNVEIKTRDTILAVICSEVKTPDGSASKRLRIEVNQNPGALQQALLAES